MKSRRITAALLLVALLIGASAVSASAFVGTGVEAISKDVRVIKSGLLGKRLSFSDGDFKSALATDDFDSLTVHTLPSSQDGVLMIANRRVREGQSIKRRALATLVFVPVNAEVDGAKFTFSVDGGPVCVCEMKFLERINYAPKVEMSGKASLTLTTQSNISVFGRMEATDPEGDKLEFIIAQYPKSGSLTLLDDGRYMYTPADSFTGYDRFVFVSRDEYGNYSDTEEVILKVTERMSEIVFRDMVDTEEYNAAVAMSAMGIMSGRLVGDDYYFMPKEGVTRAEFVAMALKAAGVRADVGESYFDDNSEIPVSLRGYVAKAARLGIVDGEYKDGKLLFSPAESISIYEAASIMCGIVGAGSDEDVEYSLHSDVPVWARADVEAMVTLGVIDDEKYDILSTVTRANAAEFLYRMVNNC